MTHYPTGTKPLSTNVNSRREEKQKQVAIRRKDRKRKTESEREREREREREADRNLPTERKDKSRDTVHKVIVMSEGWRVQELESTKMIIVSYVCRTGWAAERSTNKSTTSTL